MVSEKFRFAHLNATRVVIFPKSTFIFWAVGFWAAKITCIFPCLPRCSKLDNIPTKFLITFLSSYPEKNAENSFKHMFEYENFVFNKDWEVNL